MFRTVFNKALTNQRRLMNYRHQKPYKPCVFVEDDYISNRKIDFMIESTRSELFEKSTENDNVGNDFFKSLINKNKRDVQNRMLQVIRTDLETNQISPETKIYLDYVCSKYKPKIEKEIKSDPDEDYGMFFRTFVFVSTTFAACCMISN